MPKYSIRHLMLLTFIVAVAIWGVRTFEVQASLDGFKSLVIHGTQTDYVYGYVYGYSSGSWQWQSYPAETFDHEYTEEELREPTRNENFERAEWLQAKTKS